MDTLEKTILSQYRINLETYLELEDFALEKIENLVNDERFFTLEISHRTKSVSSLEDKLNRKLGKYKTLYNITDLCGFRIITYFSDTVDEIANKLSNIFVIDRKNSIDKRASLQANEFGYMSVHYVCSLKPEDLKEHPEFTDIHFEIQIRSILQHAWAEIEHDLGYKSEFGIPRPIRREFSRVAGLLEIADNQFIELRESVNKYESHVKERISEDEANDILLDKVSLWEYIQLNRVFLDLLGQIKDSTGIDIEIIKPDNYLELLYFFKLETLGDLSDFIERNKDSALRAILEKIKEHELDITTSNMILRFLCRAELTDNGYSANDIRQFVSIAIADKDRVERYVNSLIGYSLPSQQ